MPKKPLTERQRYWPNHIQCWNKSGMRMSEYARDQNVPVRAMYDTKKALVKRGILPRSRASYAAGFEQVQIIGSSAQSEWRITLPNGLLVEFSASFEEQILTMVLTVAAQA